MNLIESSSHIRKEFCRIFSYLTVTVKLDMKCVKKTMMLSDPI